MDPGTCIVFCGGLRLWGHHKVISYNPACERTIFCGRFGRFNDEEAATVWQDWIGSYGAIEMSPGFIIPPGLTAKDFDLPGEGLDGQDEDDDDEDEGDEDDEGDDNDEDQGPPPPKRRKTGEPRGKASVGLRLRVHIIYIYTYIKIYACVCVCVRMFAHVCM